MNRMRYLHIDASVPCSGFSQSEYRYSSSSTSKESKGAEFVLKNIAHLSSFGWGSVGFQRRIALSFEIFLSLERDILEGETAGRRRRFGDLDDRL